MIFKWMILIMIFFSPEVTQLWFLIQTRLRFKLSLILFLVFRCPMNAPWLSPSLAVVPIRTHMSMNAFPELIDASMVKVTILVVCNLTIDLDSSAVTFYRYHKIKIINQAVIVLFWCFLFFLGPGVGGCLLPLQTTVHFTVIKHVKLSSEF